MWYCVHHPCVRTGFSLCDVKLGHGLPVSLVYSPGRTPPNLPVGFESH